MKNFGVAVLLLLLALPAGGRTPQAPPTPPPLYTVRDLGSLGLAYGGNSQIVAVSAAGMVIGSATVDADGKQHAFIWTPSDGMQDLGTLGGFYSQAAAVDNGQVVGASSTASGETHAFVWTASGGMIDLGTLGGYYSSAQGINAAGQVVGSATTDSGQTHAFLWTPGAGMTDLGSLGGDYASAQFVNASGQVTGISRTSSWQDHAFFWSATTGMVDLGDLGGGESSSTAINCAGQVIGYSRTASYQSHGFFWSAELGLIDLGFPDYSSYALALNDAGQVLVTSLEPATGYNRAFLWTSTGGLQDLGTLGGSSAYPAAMNALGQVVGSASTEGEQTHTFLWSQGVMVDLGDLGGNYSHGIRVNAAGQVMGMSYNAEGRYHPFLWSPETGMLDIDTGNSNSYFQHFSDSGVVAGFSSDSQGSRGLVWTSTLGLVRLETFYQYSYSEGQFINASGQVLGYSNTPSGQTHACVWNPDGTLVDLTLGGSYSYGVALNDAGHVIGYSSTPSNESHAFFWSPQDGIVDLTALAGGYLNLGTMNAAGQVIGSASFPGGQHAFRWSSSGGMEDLGTLDGGYSTALAINDAGQVVGYSSLTDGSYHAFLWSHEGGMIDLGTLEGGTSSAVGLNASGQVIGYAGTSGGSHAFSWTSDGGMVDLGDLGRGYSYPQFINGSGQVVGQSPLATGQQRFFSWTPASGMVDLGAIGISMNNVVGLSDDGDVIGTYTSSAYNTRAFRWNAVHGLRDLGHLGGGHCEPSAVNGAGEVTGNSITASWEQHAFFRTPAGSMVDLGTIGGIYSRGNALNNSRQVTGGSQTAGREIHAVVWQILTVPPLPVILAPTTTEATGSAGADVTLDGSTSSNASGLPLTYSWTVDGVDLGSSAAISLTLSVGQHLVLLTVMDSAGLSGTQEFVLTIVDSIKPVFTSVPAPVTVEQLTPAGTALMLPSPTVTDIGDSHPTITSDAPAVFAHGTTTVTFTATDASGNFETATTTVTVQDTTSPGFSSTPVSYASLFALGPDALAADGIARLQRVRAIAGGAAGVERTIIDPNLGTLYAAAISPSGELFVSNIGGMVARFLDPLGNPQPNGTITEGLSQPFGLAFLNGELFVADPGRGEVLRYGFDPAGNAVLRETFATPYGSYMRGMVVTPWGELFISCYAVNVILRYNFDESGAAVENGMIWDWNLSGEPHGMSFSPTGELFVASAKTNEIARFRFNEAHNAIALDSIPTPGFNWVIGVAVSPWGELFAASRGITSADGTSLVSRWVIDLNGNAVPNGSFSVPGGTHELLFGPSQFLQPVPGPVVLEAEGVDGTPYSLPIPTPVDIGDSAPTVTSDAPTVFPIGTTVVTFTATDSSGNVGTATTTVTVNKLKSTVTWSTPADIVYGTPLSGVQLNALASVPGSFTYSPAAGTILPGGNGQSLHAVFQPDDAAHYDAPALSVTINVLPAGQTITFGALPNRMLAESPFTVGASASSGLPVTFAVTSGPATVAGDVVSLTGAGTVTLQASQAGDGNYLPAAPVSQSFDVSAVKSAQTISFGPLADQVYGAAPFAISATATSGLTVNLAVVSGPATIAGNLVTLTGVGTVKITATQPGNAFFNAAPPVNRQFSVLKAPQTITFGALPDVTYGIPPFALSATATSGLPVSFEVRSGPATISGNLVTLTGTGTVRIAATQAGNATYRAAPSVVQSFTVAPNQTITFPDIPNQTYGAAPIALSATASSGLPVVFTLVSGDATLVGNDLTITGTGSVKLTASQPGGGAYSAAVSVTQTFSVAKASQTITFPALANQSRTAAPFTISATASSGLAVSFTVVSGPATISGDVVTLTGATGTVKIRANQAGNENYKNAPAVIQTFSVQ